MNTERITLTMKEQKMNDILVKLIAGEIKTSDASCLTGLSERQIYRKKKAYKQCGINSIPHKSRNKSTGRGYPNNFKNNIVNLYLNEYNGWNFYHFNDMLEDFHNIKVSDTFIYNLLTSNGIESPNKYKQRKTSHPPRDRKEFAGELLQIDASKHKWFYGDDNYYHLHGVIDDSTGIVTGVILQNKKLSLVIKCFYIKRLKTMVSQNVSILIIVLYFNQIKKNFPLKKNFKEKKLKILDLLICLN